MKPALLSLLLLLPLASPALASAPPAQEVCSPHLAFIHPNPPVVCVIVSFAGICLRGEGGPACVTTVNLYRLIAPLLP